MFHLVFFQPCIPPNTGNAIRLAANTGVHLHLIEPLGFSMEETKLRRAGLDYHDLASVTVHPSLDDFFTAVQPRRCFAFSAHTNNWYTSVNYQEGDALLFGPEPEGLPPEVVADARMSATLRIPMLPHSRSLNLANSASVVVYEAWRQHNFPGAL